MNYVKAVKENIIHNDAQLAEAREKAQTMMTRVRSAQKNLASFMTRFEETNPLVKFKLPFEQKVANAWRQNTPLEESEIELLQLEELKAFIKAAEDAENALIKEANRTCETARRAELILKLNEALSEGLQDPAGLRAKGYRRLREKLAELSWETERMGFDWEEAFTEDSPQPHFAEHFRTQMQALIKTQECRTAFSQDLIIDSLGLKSLHGDTEESFVVHDLQTQERIQKMAEDLILVSADMEDNPDQDLWEALRVGRKGSLYKIPFTLLSQCFFDKDAGLIFCEDLSLTEEETLARLYEDGGYATLEDALNTTRALNA